MDLDYDDCKPKQMFYSQADCNPMDVLFQRRCARYIYVVPEGLRELMSDITREVLRCQPKEIYCFIADYLDALMITRENAKVAALFVENVTEAGSTLRDILYNTSLTLEQAVRACRIIQRAFRRHLNMKKDVITTPLDPYMIICKMMVRLKITYEQASEAARVIQKAWRFYKMRMEVWRSRFQTTLDWRTACRYTLRLYRQYASTWEYNCAATIIQAAYRGYYTRRLLKLYSRIRRSTREELLEYLAQQYEEAGEEGPEYSPAYQRHLRALRGLSGGVSMETLYILYDPEDKAARVIQRTFKRLMKRASTRGTLHFEAEGEGGVTIIEIPNEDTAAEGAEAGTRADSAARAPSAGAPASTDRAPSAGAPASPDRAPSAGAPASPDRAPSAGAPATTDRAPSAGAPATTDRAPSAGAPATTDRAPSAGAPATTDRAPSAGAPASPDRAPSAGAPASTDRAPSAGAPATTDGAPSAGEPAPTERSASAGRAPSAAKAPSATRAVSAGEAPAAATDTVTPAADTGAPLEPVIEEGAPPPQEAAEENNE